jgi:hypothetical protein
VRMTGHRMLPGILFVCLNTIGFALSAAAQTTAPNEWTWRVAHPSLLLAWVGILLLERNCFHRSPYWQCFQEHTEGFASRILPPTSPGRH